MSDANPQKSAPAASFEVDGNRLTLLIDGPDRLEALIALIDGASDTLLLLYYIFLDDESGRKVRDAVVEATRRGVRVSLLVDGFGTDAASTAELFAPLIEGASRFCRFEPRWGRRYLLRNHQKMAVADGRVAIVGGFNIGDEYFGTIEQGAWRDLGLRVEGPTVENLVPYYELLFRWSQKPNSTLRRLRRILHRHSVPEGRLQWLFGGPARRLSPWAQVVKADMLRAQRLDMIAAYFAPSRSMLRRIYGIGRRGRARIVTAYKSDNGFTIAAARHSYWRLLRRGVLIYEYQPTKLHTKLIVIDDIVHVGSANFDMRSLYINLEMMLRVDDPTFADALVGYVDGEVKASTQISRTLHAKQRTWWNRLRWSIAHFIVATMDYNLFRRFNLRGGGE